MIEKTRTRFGLSYFSLDFVTRVEDGQVSRRPVGS
jgi:hypothetical protein